MQMYMVYHGISFFLGTCNFFCDGLFEGFPFTCVLDWVGNINDPQPFGSFCPTKKEGQLFDFKSTFTKC